MYDNISLLIQGPINDPNKLNFIDNIEYFKSLFPEIVLSTYVEHLNADLLKFCVDNNITIVAQKENIGNFDNRYNIYKQTLTTLTGLKVVNNKYCLKHRTDEKYSNLNKVIDLFLQDDEKWVSGTTVFGEKSYYLFHAADHLFVGKTEKLKKTFELTMQNLKQNIMERNADGEPAAEVTFTKNYIRVCGGEPDPHKHDEQMLKYFNFVSDIELYPFLIRVNSGNKLFTEPEHIHIDRRNFIGCKDMHDLLRR